MCKKYFSYLDFYSSVLVIFSQFIRWRGGAVAARLAHTQEDDGASPSHATRLPDLPEWDSERSGVVGVKS